MKKTIKYILGTMGILLGGVIIGTLLLTVAFSLPVNEKNRTASFDIIYKEGWYPAMPIVASSLDIYFHSYMPGVLDDSTDALMLSTALNPQEKNALLAAMDMNEYDYYGHGYVSVLRPLLAVFDYGEIRVLNGVLQLLLVLLLFLQIYRKKGMVQALMVPTSYCLLMPLAMPLSLQFTWIFYVAVCGTLVLTIGEQAENRMGIKLYWVFMIIGMCTSYLDLLTYPLFTWGFPLVWWLLLKKKNRNAFFYVKEVVFAGLWWILGYGGFWVGKWAVGSLILKRNIFESAWFEVFYRLGAKEEVGGYDISQRLEVLYTNWKHYEYKIYVLILAAWLIWFAWNSINKGLCFDKKNKAYALIACSSIVWYLALANHTGGHHFFTYRIYGVSVLAILALFTESVKTESCVDGSQKLKTICVWCMCGILACGLSFLAREEIDVLNTDRSNNKQIAMSDAGVCTMRFTPTFPMISAIGICLETDSLDGACILRILDGEKVLYEETISLKKYEDTVYTEIPVSWKLKKNHDYTMELSLEGTEAGIRLLLTEDMTMPILEYGEVSIDEMAKGGQILSSLTYNYRPLSKFTLAFLAMTWCAILMAVYVSLIGKNKMNR